MKLKIRKYKNKNVPKALKTRQLLCMEVCAGYLKNPETYTKENGKTICGIIDRANTDIICSPMSCMDALLIDFRNFTDDLTKVKDLPDDLTAFIAYAACFGYNGLIIRDNEDTEYNIEYIYPGIRSILYMYKKEEIQQ